MTMRCSLAILLVIITGCGSSPRTHFYALNVVPGAAEQMTATSSRVQLVAVHLPPALDRRSIVRMTGSNSVQINDTERWSAPLDEMVRNVLSRDIAERLPEGTVVLPDAPAPARTDSLVVTIAQFGPDASGLVRLEGSWSLLAGSSDTPMLQHDFRLDAGSATTDGDATAAAMSRAVGDLAANIASTLTQQRQSSHAQR